MDAVEFLYDGMDEIMLAMIKASADKDPPIRGGSNKGRSPNLNREIHLGHKQIMNDYLSPNATYPEYKFRRRFRMSSRLFRRICQDLREKCSYFMQRRNAAGNLGASTEQKLTAAIRMLAYGVSADFLDDYVRLGESTIMLCMKKFCCAVIELYGDYYLRKPSDQDIKRILTENEKRGFPGMLGSIDCTHWFWKNCPTAWAGQMTGKDGSASIVLEAIATYDLHIWHLFFGMPGSCNDINVLDRSSLFADLLAGRAPPSSFILRGTEHAHGYYLADGIYPPWSTFVQSFSQPNTQKKKYFTKLQESLRKDVERAFGALKARWHIIAQPSRLWFQDDMHNIITACVIMHNMIVEDQIGEYVEEFEPSQNALVNCPATTLSQYTLNLIKVQDREANYQLRCDLIDHVWDLKGAQQ